MILTLLVVAIVGGAVSAVLNHEYFGWARWLARFIGLLAGVIYPPRYREIANEIRAIQKSRQAAVDYAVGCLLGAPVELLRDVQERVVELIAAPTAHQRFLSATALACPGVAAFLVGIAGPEDVPRGARVLVFFAGHLYASALRRAVYPHQYRRYSRWPLTVRATALFAGGHTLLAVAALVAVGARPWVLCLVMPSVLGWWAFFGALGRRRVRTALVRPRTSPRQARPS